VLGVDAFHMAGPAQRLQAPDMGADEGLRVLALPLETVADAVGMPARLVDAVLRHDGDVPVRWPWAGHRGLGLDDHAAVHFVDAGRVGEFHVVDAAVHTVDHQIDPLTHFVAGQPLANDPADHRLA